MIIKPRGSVIIPKMPRSVGSILSWCREVNRAIQQLRDRAFVTYGGGTGGGGRVITCHFGEIITIEGTPDVSTIRGGIIYCGDQNWSMDADAISLSPDGVWLVSIAVSVVVNTDDDGEILLPGIDTGTKPTGGWTRTSWTAGTDYPDNTAPTIPTGAGTIVIPIGKLTVASGVASLEAAGCGHITVGHCAGTLSHTRG